MQDLEKLVEKLEKGELTLEASLNHFEKGVSLTKKCTQVLTEAEQKVKKLTEENELETFIDIEEDEWYWHFMSTYPPALLAIKTRFQSLLNDYLSTLSSPSKKLLTAVNYAAMTPGKYLRPLLIYATGDLLECDIKRLDAPALSIELLHTYSLVHDDLPAMDDDDLRRGQPSCHKAFDEATAILVGDALQSLSLQVLLESQDLKASQKQSMALTLLQASGIKGMVAGQALDLAWLGETKTAKENLDAIHKLKTGKLFSACILFALQAKALSSNSSLYQALLSYSEHIGIAFQVQDDYLDRYGETETLGKHQGSDMKQGKITYADFYDKSALKNLINTYYHNALSALKPYEDKAQRLNELTILLKERSH